VGFVLDIGKLVAQGHFYELEQGAFVLSKRLNLLVVMFCFFGCGLLWAANPLVKAESIMGEVTYQKDGKGEWIPLRVGAKLKQADKVRTAVESQAGLRFENGSLLTVSENTLIELKTLLENGGASNTKIGVKTGKLLFNIQKLANGKSSFEFEAQTATAAIRGTEGDVQVNGARSLASLQTGRLEMSSANGHATIGPGQMVLQTSKGFVVLPKPKDPKAYQELVSKYLQDTSAHTDSLVQQVASHVDSLVKTGAIVVADSGAVRDSSTKLDSTKTTSQDSVRKDVCALGAIPAEVMDSKLHVQGTASEGLAITIGSLRTQVSGGAWAMDLAWDATQFGVKSYPVVAMRGDVPIPCGDVKFVYKPAEIPLALKLTTPSPARVCKGPLTLSGYYVGTAARLQAKVGGALLDLSNTTGQFQRTVEISDLARNWDVTQVEFLLTDQSKSLSTTLPLLVDRTCPEVNRIPPSVTFTAEPLQCYGNLSVSGVAGDEAQISLLVDGSELESFTINNEVRGRKLNLSDGIHNYLLKAIDLAGNKAESKLTKQACWPDVRFDITMDGGATEVVRQPPPPPGQSFNFSKTIRFTIRNLPRDEIGYLKRVSLKLNGRKVQEWKGTQLTSVNFESTVELERNKLNILVIEAEHQNGRLRTLEKEYDFK